MSLTLDFSELFYTGGAPPSAEVPGRFDVGLAGRGFMIDWNAPDPWQRASIPLLRQQADQSSQPTESSINPEDLWRRTVSDFSRGAGQRNFDSIGDSDPARFFESKGIDPWTKGQFSLLPATASKRASGNTNLDLAAAGSYLYLIDGGDIVYTQDITAGTPTWTDITGEPANAATSITSDGYSVWTAHGTNGVYVTTRGAGSTASSYTGTVAGVRYANGRLFAWSTDKLYNLVTPGALPAALLDHPNSDFTWVDVCEGPGFYYAAGYAGDKSLIYKTAVKPDGTGLDAPTVAGSLPDGEVVRSLHAYLGYVLIGTDKGLRFAVPNESTGSLTIGGDIETGSPVRCFEPQGRYVWFGWSAFDGTSTGLGRLDLSVFNEGGRPAYASDLMAAGSTAVTSVVTFQDIRVFAVSGFGIFAETADLVSSGTWRIGTLSYGLYDPKVTMFVTVSHSPLEGGLHAELAVDGGDFTDLSTTGGLDGTTRTDFPTNRARGENFDIRLTLSRDPGDTTTGPTVKRLTLRSKPAAARSEQIIVPLLLGFGEIDRTGSMYARDAIDDLEFLGELEEGGESHSYQEGSLSFTVIAEDHVWAPDHPEEHGLGFGGTYTIRLKRFATE